MIELLLAAVIGFTEVGGVTVRLTDEPCALEAVTNMPNRATWTEAGVVTEGCFGIQGTLLLAYWADKTVTALPVRAFQRVSAT